MLHYNKAAFIANYLRWCRNNECPHFFNALTGALEGLPSLPKNEKRIAIYVGEQMSDFVRSKLEELPKEMDIILIVKPEYHFGTGLDTDDELITTVVHGCTDDDIFDLFSI